MTYKQAIDAFQIEYRNTCLANKITETLLKNEQVFYYISKVCSDLAFYERLVPKLKTIDLVLAQYEYVTGTGDSHIPEGLTDVIEIKFGEGTDDEVTLERVSIEDLPEGERASGKPAKWTIYYANDSRKLILDISPDASYTSTNGYRLYMYYFQKLFTYYGTAEDTYSDLAFGSSGYGGSFVIPTEWESVVIMKAVSQVLPIGLRNNYELIVSGLEQKIRQSKPIYASTKLKYKIGVGA